MTKVSAFTLIELLILIAIIGILAAVVFLLLNPIAYFNRARDANRIQDAGSFRQTLDFNIVQRGGKWDPDGTYTDSCVGESNQRVFVSVPGDSGGNCVSPPNDLPAGWVYECVPEADIHNIDGSGWIPVNLTGTGAGSPLSVLPVDPTNTFESGYYYSYVCGRIGGKSFEITARMASKRFRAGGDGDIQSGDGGDDIFIYEVGSDLQLDPKAPVAYWAMNEGSGTSIADSSGYGHNGSFLNSPVWATEVNCIRGPCLEFDGGIDAVDFGNVPGLTDIVLVSIVSWVNAETTGVMRDPRIYSKDGDSDGQWGTHFSLRDIAGLPSPLRFRRGWTGGGFCGWGGCFAHWVTNADVISADQWHHAAVTYNGSNTANDPAIYADGNSIPVTEEFSPGGSLESESAYNSGIGNSISPPERGWDGYLDEIGVYNRVLDAVEVEYQYESLKP